MRGAMSGRVLIIDGVAANRILMKARLASACYDPVPVPDGETAVRMAREAEPDAVILDLDLADPGSPAECGAGAGRPALRVLRQFRAEPELAQVPLLVLVAAQDDAGRIAAFRAGADAVIAKPVDDRMLLARLRSLIRGRAALADLGGTPMADPALGFAEGAARFDAASALPCAAGGAEAGGTVALVTARPDTGLRLRRDLSNHACGRPGDSYVLRSRSEALTGSADEVPDVYVIEWDMEAPGDGLHLLSDLRSRGAGRHACYLMLRPQGVPAATDAMAYDIGAHEVAEHGCDPCELALRIAALTRRKRQADRLRASVHNGLRLAVIDPLTGLHNRRYALGRLAGMADAARTDGSGFAVLVADLDRFKRVNDRWGHPAGDAVLVEVARRLAQGVRPGDLVARIGGEEFLVALPRVGLSEARQIAERLCAAVQEAPVVLPDGTRLQITASIGLAICEGSLLDAGQAVPQTIDSADRALLRAKSAGRNQVTVSLDAA